jgi:hypothetical protein
VEGLLVTEHEAQHSIHRKAVTREMTMCPRLNIIPSRLVQVASLSRQVGKKWRAYGVYLSALLIFSASRLVVIIGVHFGALLVPTSNPGKWDAGPAWYHRLLRWDAGWYASIVRDGYRYSDDDSIASSVAFHPLYPLLSYAAKMLFGIDEYLALLLVANTASLVAILLMAKFVTDELGSEIAVLSLACFCFFPSSLFLSAGYTEPLCLVFILLSLILLTREKFVLSAIMAGLSLATRSTGIVMIPVILWEMWQKRTLPWSLFLPRMALCVGLASSGLLVYMAYLAIRFGHPLAFATAQGAWHRGTFLDRLVSTAMLGPFQYFNWRGGGSFLCFLALTIWSFRSLRFSVSLYALGSLLLPYLALGIDDSMNRYVLMCFPAFMCLGILCKGRPWLASVLIGIFASLLLTNAALFSQWYYAG